MNKDSRILIGKVSGCFGVKGWLKIFSYTEPRENITSYKKWLIDGKSYDSTAAKKHGKLIIVKLDGVDDKDRATTFLGKKIEIESEQLHALEKGEYYWKDLIGLQVSNQDGVEFGIIKNLF